jgi:hypothetical protein
MLIHFRGQYMDRPFGFSLTFEGCDVCSSDWDMCESSVFYKPFLVPSVIQKIESTVGRTIGGFSAANHDFVEIREVVDTTLPPDEEEWVELTLLHVNTNICMGRNWSRFR